jgi:hypothetical protein
MPLQNSRYPPPKVFYPFNYKIGASTFILNKKPHSLSTVREVCIQILSKEILNVSPKHNDMNN